MTPRWIKNNARFDFIEKDQVHASEVALSIPSDTSKNENIFRVPLLGKNKVGSDDDITVRIVVGLVLPEPAQPRDPLAFMVSDGRHAVGIRLQDPRDYGTIGPYVGVEGRPGRTLQDITSESPPTSIRTGTRNNPDQFEIVIKPTQYWGSAYCALDGGNKLCVAYSSTLDVNEGVLLDVYRYEANETYTLNYIEVWIYRDSPLP
jgi:hypothetical protein